MRVVITLILSVILSACSRLSLPSFIGNQLGIGEREQLLASINQRAQEIRSFKALLRAKLLIGEQRSSVRYLLLADLPSRLHLEALAPNAAYAMAVLVADKERLLLLDPAPKRAYLGRSDAAHLKRALNIPLAPEWLASLVLGRLPQSYLAALPSLQTQFKRSPDLLQIMLKQGEYERFFVFSAENGLLQRMQLRDQFSTKLLLEMRFLDYQIIEQLSVPAQIEIDLPPDNAHISIKVTNPKLNNEIAEKLFAQEIPPGYESEELR